MWPVACRPLRSLPACHRCLSVSAKALVKPGNEDNWDDIEVDNSEHVDRQTHRCTEAHKATGRIQPELRAGPTLAEPRSMVLLMFCVTLSSLGRAVLA